MITIFVLSEEQQAIFDMAHDFAEQMIAPHAVNWNSTEQMPKDVLRHSAELGLASIYVPEDMAVPPQPTGCHIGV